MYKATEIITKNNVHIDIKPELKIPTANEDGYINKVKSACKDSIFNPKTVRLSVPLATSPSMTSKERVKIINKEDIKKLANKAKVLDKIRVKNDTKVKKLGWILINIDRKAKGKVKSLKTGIKGFQISLRLSSKG